MTDISDYSDYKKEFLNRLRAGLEANSISTEDNFFEDVSELLMDRGIYDDIEPKQYRNTNKGIFIHGYSWNDVEKILSGVIVKFSNNDEIVTISQSEIEKLGKQCSRFISNLDNENFFDSLAVTDPGRELAEIMRIYKNQAIKYRIIVLTDYLMSDRVKRNQIKINNIFDKKTTIEICDLERIKNIDQTDDDASENFTVDFSEFTEDGGIKTLEANVQEDDISSYICIMPATVLSKLFDEYGQKLLESNVRTFLQFKKAPNAAMKATLLKNPSDFFSYNNGLTVTASDVNLENSKDGKVIKSIENMQIVNGGQTTSVIYFGPKEKGSQEGIDFRSIDLSKVFIQMKLTVIKNKDKSEEIKSNVARYANLQNAIQASDLISNHPLHRLIEKHSRKHSVPVGDNDTSVNTFWFYERARGQYATRLRALPNKTAQRKFEELNPKHQVFSKTDFAKYENTWRMNPNEVKLGAQKNLKEIGEKLIAEYDKDERNFELPFYKDLISKMILFKATDKAIQREATWYQPGGGGLKAETVTYTVALLRHFLVREKKDINLNRIYENQNISETLKKELLSLGKIVREKIIDINFRDGASNPSEFCKTKKAWEKFKKLDYSISHLDKKDFISGQEIKEKKDNSKNLSDTSSSVSAFEEVSKISKEEWNNIQKYLMSSYGKRDYKMGVLSRLAKGKTDLQLKDYDIALSLLKTALEKGYILTSQS
jgi:hypothetical protein